MITANTVLPTFEELTVEEIPMGTAALRAGSFHIGQSCQAQNNEFMLCRKEYKHDPRPCVEDGKAVTACALKFFKQVKANCATEFTNYATCLDKSSASFEMTPCRKTQHIFDLCVKEKLNIDRPHLTFMSLTKIHETDRPRPEEPKPAYLNDPSIKKMRSMPGDFPSYDHFTKSQK